MCLIVDRKIEKVKPKKSLFTRSYYKVLYYGLDPYDGKKHFMTPYYSMWVSLGNEYEIPKDSEWEMTSLSVGKRMITVVDGGCFHLFRTKKGAEDEYNAIGSGGVIVKAVVPAGTEYIKGEYCGNKSICVRKVRYETL